MKRTQILAAAACALMVFSLLGCGATNKLQSVTLTVVKFNGNSISGTGGVINLQGTGSTLNLQATANYSGSGPTDVTHHVTYNVIVDPLHGVDNKGAALLVPCAGPCPAPFDGVHGTVEYDQTGLITAVEPAVCTWVNNAVDPSTTPAWAYTGDYQVTATFKGVTSQPIYIPVGSAAGPYDQYSNPTGQCGPTPP